MCWRGLFFVCVFFFFAETKEDVWTSAASRFFMDRLPQPVFSPVDVRACVPIRHVRLSAFFFFYVFFSLCRFGWHYEIKKETWLTCNRQQQQTNTKSHRWTKWRGDGWDRGNLLPRETSEDSGVTRWTFPSFLKGRQHCLPWCDRFSFNRSRQASCRLYGVQWQRALQNGRESGSYEAVHIRTFFSPPLCLVLFLQIDSAFSCGLFRKPRLRKNVASFVASECRVLKTKTKKTELVFRCRVYFDMCVCVCMCAHFSPPSQVDFVFFRSSNVFFFFFFW